MWADFQRAHRWINGWRWRWSVFWIFTCAEAPSLCPITENETLNVVIVDELLGTLKSPERKIGRLTPQFFKPPDNILYIFAQAKCIQQNVSSLHTFIFVRCLSAPMLLFMHERMGPLRQILKAEYYTKLSNNQILY